MTVSELVDKLELKVYAGQSGLNKEITSGYASDLLSDVMGFAKSNSVWITLQTHKNITAIASLKDISAIVLVKGNEPEPDTILQADEEDIPILGTSDEAFEIIGKIHNLIFK